MSEKKLHGIITDILNLAKEEMDVANYFLFSTTLEQIEILLNLMRQMKAGWEKDGLTVKKNYGQKLSDATHPLIQDYNKTAKSVATLINTCIRLLNKCNISTDKETKLKSLIEKMNENEE